MIDFWSRNLNLVFRFSCEIKNLQFSQIGIVFVKKVSILNCSRISERMKAIYFSGKIENSVVESWESQYFLFTCVHWHFYQLSGGCLLFIFVVGLTFDVTIGAEFGKCRCTKWSYLFRSYFLFLGTFLTFARAVVLWSSTRSPRKQLLTINRFFLWWNRIKSNERGE